MSYDKAVNGSVQEWREEQWQHQHAAQQQRFAVPDDDTVSRGGQVAKKTTAKIRRSSRLTLVDGPPNYASSSPSFFGTTYKVCQLTFSYDATEHNLADPRTMNKRGAAPVTLEEHTAYAHQLMTNSQNGLNTQGEDGARNELENHRQWNFAQQAAAAAVVVKLNLHDPSSSFRGHENQRA